jgi:biotin carboxylase
MPPESALPPAAAKKDLVILVDPYSTGCIIAQEMMRRGFLVVALWTRGFAEEMKLHVPQSCQGSLHYYDEVDELETLDETVAALEAVPHNVVACLAGGEAGVDFADALSERMGLLTNGTDIPNRRDKKIQQELIKAAGLRSVRQAGGSEFDQVKDFLETEQYPVVLKPTESAGSDGVKLCHSFKEAREHFELLMKSQMVNGGQCPAVLCQEFLRGKEYVVDHVSRDGIHKTTMVWVYDKRPANGSAFVYFGCVPVDPQSPEARILIPYVRGVLDALGVRNGPSHGEVMMTAEGPCLVEMNCRAHGGDGNWRPLCRALTGGYSQVEATVEAYLEPSQFAKLPDKPPSPFKASGQEVILCSYSRGKVVSTPGYEVIKNLPSFLVLESSVGKGTEVEHTVDLVTCLGSVILMHPDPTTLQKDIEFVRHMEKINGFFVYETKLENLKRPRGDAIISAGHRRDFSAEGPTLIRHFSNDRPELRGMMRRTMTTTDASKEAVVLVDPYSTGCCVAQEISKRGYTIMALWTKGFAEDMKKHVPLSCEGLTYRAEVDEGNGLDDTVVRIKKAAGMLRVVAVIAGGEAGVDLADALSEKMNLRTNGTEVPNRRDKKIQQELVKAAGFRSVRQSAGSVFEEVEEFLHTEPYPVVLKPIESAGSDGVKLCHNFEEAKEHFHVLMKSQMVNGGQCPAVLCQEFLRGKEYVVDHVSRDGIHKTAMVWVYDKRPANGSAFVYFGCVPVDPQSPEARVLISYTRGVLDAIGVSNGPSHGEIMMTADGPCLVEMNCRAHGGDGNWRPLCRGLTGGYSQVEATVDAYLEKKAFFDLPDKPPSPFKASGQEVILVSYARGTVKSTPGYDKIMKLQSFVYLETGVRPGSKVDYTIDLFTGIGSVILMHEDNDILEADVRFIRKLEEDNALFEFEPEFNLLHSFSKMNVLNTDGQPKHKRVISSSRPDMF